MTAQNLWNHLSLVSLWAETRETVHEHWGALLVVVTALVEVMDAVRLALTAARPPLTDDAAFFQHAGWYLTRGGRLYVDIWDVKLPLTHETSALLALLSGGDPYVLHLVSVAVMILLTCGIVLLVGLLAHYLTEDVHASLVAGFSMYLLPGFVIRPAYGLKAKYPLLLFGLLALYLFVEHRPLLAGAAAAASVGYWQLGAVFPLVIVGLALHRRDRRALVRVLVGGCVVTVLMFLPVVVLWHATSEMLVQTVLAPLVVTEKTPLLDRLVAGVVHFKYASPLVLVGTYGLLRGARARLGRDDWWVLACAGWFAFVVLFVDFEIGGYTDLIPGLAFVALGLALFVATTDDPRVSRIVTVVVVVVCVVNVVWFGAFGVVFEPTATPDAVRRSHLRSRDDSAEGSADIDSVDTTDVRYYYWNRVEPETCHYRLSILEHDWLARLGLTPSDDCVDLSTARARLGG